MRLLACTLAAFASIACTSSMRTYPGPPTDLRITVWPQGKGKGEPRKARLQCDPAGGTFASPAEACRRLAALKSPFAPVPPDVACTQIYGGPDVAVVTGRFRMRHLWTAFRRTNGCEIARWNRVAFLFARAAR
jgi:Subtilisin inhibitor-like